VEGWQIGEERGVERRKGKLPNWHSFFPTLSTDFGSTIYHSPSNSEVVTNGY